MQTPPRKTMRTVFHADLSDAHPGEDYWLVARGRRHRLIPHTADSRAKARAGAPHLARVPDASLSHYTAEPVELPADRVVRVHLKHSLKTFPNAKGRHGVGHVAIHVPPSPERLRQLEAAGAFAQQPIDYVSTAKALVFHHADLINDDPETTQIIYDYMDNDANISTMFQLLGQQMRQMGPPTETSGWALLVPFTPPPDNTLPDGGPYYFHQPTSNIKVAAGPVTTAMMKATKNDLRLKGKKWTQQTGVSVQGPEASGSSSSLASRVRPMADTESWSASLAKTAPVHGLQMELEVVDATQRQIKLTLKNTYIRYLGAYIRFFDAEGNAMSVPDWKPDDGGIIAGLITDVLDVQYDDLRFLGYVKPVDNVMAVPITSEPGELEVTLTLPDGAVSAAVYGAGLGTGANEWPKTPIVGGVLTGLLNLGVPAFMLAFGVAAQSYKPLYDIVEELSKNKKFIGSVIGGGIAYFGTEFGISAAHREMNWSAFSSLAEILFTKAAEKALVWVEEQVTEGAIAEEIPFAGWILLALEIATGIAQIAETIVAVATSPWNIENQLATSITTDVTLHPDPRFGAFPQAPPGTTVTCTVKLMYKDQARPTVAVSQTVPVGSTSTSLAASFPNNTLGGQVKLEADYYVGTWLAGKATTSWFDNDEDSAADVSLYLVQNPVPLTSESVYQHTALLTYQDGAYTWMNTPNAPTGTVANRNTSSTGNAISQWAGLTLSQRNAMLGFAWKAAGMGITSVVTGQGGQLFAMQNIDIPGTPMNAVKFPSAGFDGPTQLIYDPYPPKFLMKDGQWVLGPDGKPEVDPEDVSLGAYYVDPRKAAVSLDEGGGFHLRKVVLDDSSQFDLGSTQPSHGRFPYFPDSFALHPSGYAIAVSTQYNKIQITPLNLDGVEDNELPVAQVYAGEATDTERPGLIFYPVAVTCSYDGTIFVLEDTKASGLEGQQVVARVQAFDLYGNPVNRFFDDQGNPTPFLPLQGAGDYTYLDIAAVGDPKMTYLYVLYYTGDGSAASDYAMAIYQYGDQPPSQNPLVTTNGVAAAKVAVDMWHTVYTLNYDMVTNGQGQPSGPSNGTTGPAGRTVPSVSEWLPPVPSN